MDFRLSVRPQGKGFVFYATRKVWNREKKKQNNEQVYLGSFRKERCRFNDKAREFSTLFQGTKYEQEYWIWRESEELRKSGTRQETVPVQKVIEAEVKNAGVALLLDKVEQTLGLSTKLKAIFGEELSAKILSLAYFCAMGNKTPLGMSQRWLEDHVTPWDEALTDGQVSQLLGSITASDILRFQSLWTKSFSKEDTLCFDITSISSYGTRIPDVVKGYNRDKENLPQINLLMLVSQRSRLPVWYQQMPGAISDMNTVKDAIKILQSMGGFPQSFVLDRGFACVSNINSMMDNRVKFTIGLPLWNFEKERQEIRKAYEANEFCNPKGTLDMFDSQDIMNTQAVTRLWKVNGHRAYLHMYYTDFYRARDNADMMDNLKRISEELQAGKSLETQTDIALAQKCFTVKKTPKRGIRVIPNNEAIATLRNECEAGFFAILSTQFKSAQDALYVYKLRDSVEKRFDDLKNEEDAYRLRVHSPRNMQGRLFIQFIAQILRCKLLTTLQNETKKRPTRVKSVTNLLWSIDSVRRFSLAGHRPIYTRATKLQREIFEFFDVPINPKQWPSLEEIGYNYLEFTKARR